MNSTTIETLESRRMMSAAVKAGVLQIVGTEAEDLIKVTLQETRIIVTTNGVREGRFARGAVKRISIDARASDDRIEIATNLTTRSIVHGGLGDDVILGGGGSDSLFGDDGDDILRGRTGDDMLDPGAGQNSLDGGAGIDAVSYATSRPSGIFVDLDNQNAWTPDGEEPIDTFVGIENAIGSKGDDTLRGGARSTALWGGGGNDVLRQYNKAPTSLFGGDGNDTLYGVRDATNLLDGGAGSDTVDYGDHYYGPVSISLDGEANDGADGENDQILRCENIRGTSYGDTLTGDDGPNRIDGSSGNDSIDGGAGNDTLTGGFDNDTIHGDEGDDEIHGSQDNDVLAGDDGNDSIWGEDGNDILRGGDGDDALFGYFASATSGLADNDTLSGGRGTDNLYGGGGDDNIDALDGERDYIYGGAGNDRARVDLPVGGNSDNADSFSDVELLVASI